jgi:hypothetical protein
MSLCPTCHHEVVDAVLGDGTNVLLEHGPRTYIALDTFAIFAQDGDRVFASAALVEHAVLCPAQRRAQAEARTAGKQRYDADTRHKKGV